MIRARSADGKIHEFPPGTDSAVIDRVMKDYARQTTAKPSMAKDFTRPIRGAWKSLKEGVASDYERAQRQASGKERPGNFFEETAEDVGRSARLAGNIFGLAVSPVSGAIDAAVARPAARELNKLPMRPYAPQSNPFEMPRALEGEEAEDFLAGEINTAIAGARAPGSKIVNVRQSPLPAPKAARMKPEQLKPAKDAAYAAADAAGVKYKASTFDGLISVMESELKAAKLNPMRHPKAASMLDDVKAMRGQQPTLTELDQLRQVIRQQVASAPDQSDARLGKLMIDQIDDFIRVAGPKQVVAGDAKGGADAIRTARDMNTRLRKVEAVEEAVDSARLRAGSTGSGGNVDNATRQNLRRVLETGNWTPDEAAALEEIVMGGNAQNVLRLIGKLSPQGNGLMTALNIGGAAANPLLAIPGLSGLLAKMAADGMTARKVQQALQLIAAGGTKATRASAIPSARSVVAPATATNPFVGGEVRRPVPAER